MLDLKVLNSALEQLEAERGIPKEKIVEAIEDALAAAYKRDYGKRGQIVRAHFDLASGKAEFSQIKTVVDESMVRIEEDITDDTQVNTDASKIRTRLRPSVRAGRGFGRTPEESMATERGQKDNNAQAGKNAEESDGEGKEEDERVRFNPEHHILLEDAKKIKKDAKLEDEIIFPLESKDEYGRIAAQTAKQVIIQRIREAERVSVLSEYEKRKGEIVSGTIQRVERGTVFIDLGKVVGAMPKNEQIPGEYYRQGERLRAYLYSVEETPRDITLRLSRTHPQFLQKLFEVEAPEVASGVVEIKNIAREPGMRSKIAVASNDEHIDPVGSLVGQRGVRVATVMSELGGEKIDIIEWAEEPERFVERALSPAHVEKVTLEKDTKNAIIEVDPDQYSLAIGRGGQNARLAARLTGWKIDIRERAHGQEFVTDEGGADMVSKETNAAEQATDAEGAPLKEEKGGKKITEKKSALKKKTAKKLDDKKDKKKIK